MPIDRKPFPILPLALALAALLALYVGAYYAMVRPMDFRPLAVFPRYSPFHPHGMTVEEIESGRRRKWFFAPMHAIDRRIRPHVWEP